MNQNEITNLYENKEELSDYTESEQSETEETNTSVDENELTELLEEISHTLTAIINKNKNNREYDNKFGEAFFVKTAPPITIYDYLNRIQRYLNIEASTFILSLIYIDRICKEKGIILHKKNIHKILFSSIFISIKYNEDKFYENSFYAKIAGISVKELIKLENVFLKLIDFNLFVSDDIYQKYSSYLFCVKKV